MFRSKSNIILVLLAILNAIDGISTYYFYIQGAIIELNPIMNYVLSRQPSVFLVMKLVLTLLLLIFVAFKGEVLIKGMLKTLVSITFYAYAIVVVLHLSIAIHWFA